MTINISVRLASNAKYNDDYRLVYKWLRFSYIYS